MVLIRDCPFYFLAWQRDINNQWLNFEKRIFKKTTSFIIIFSWVYLDPSLVTRNNSYCEWALIIVRWLCTNCTWGLARSSAFCWILQRLSSPPQRVCQCRAGYWVHVPSPFFFIWAIQQMQERWTLTWECVLCAEARSNAFTCTPPVILGGPLFPPFYGGVSGGLS